MVVLRGSADATPAGVDVDVVIDHLGPPPIAMIRKLHDLNPVNVTIIAVRDDGSGRAKLRNRGAGYGRAPLVLFLSEHVRVTGEWVRQVHGLFRWDDDCVLAAESGHPSAVVVRRSWFGRGFDERYIRSHELAALIAKARSERRVVADRFPSKSISVVGPAPCDVDDEYLYLTEWGGL